MSSRTSTPTRSSSTKPIANRSAAIGLRGAALKSLATTELVEVVDMRAFVQAQRETACGGAPWPGLRTPVEGPYPR